MFSFLKKIFNPGPKVDLAQLYADGAIIVDVRSQQEYQSGHIQGAINVPLQSLPKELAKLKKMNKPIITCCLSGGRSASAKSILVQQGMEAYNGGGWQSLQSKLKRR